jgi:hypothetical protein
MKKERRFRRARRLGVTLAAAGLVPVLGGVSLGDALLRPATLQGAYGLSGVGVEDFAYVSVAGNARNYFASSLAAGGAYALTTEGDQTYDAVSIDQFFGSASVGVRSRAPLSLAVGTATTLDLTRPGGTITGQINVINNPPDPNAPVVAQLTSASLTATASATVAGRDETYAGAVYDFSGGNALALPMAAAGSVAVAGAVTFGITDAVGNSCMITRAFAPQTTELAAGGSVAITEDLDVSTASCTIDILQGSVAINNLPRGLEVASSEVRLSSDAAPYRPPTTLTGNAQPYSFSYLQEGRYNLSASASVVATDGSASALTLPPGLGLYVDVTAGSTITRDFVFDGAAATGRVFLAGPAAGLVNFFDVQYRGAPGANAGGLSDAAQSLSPGTSSLTYRVAVTSGAWVQGPTTLGYFDEATSTQGNVVITDAAAPLTFGRGSTLSRPDVTLSLASGQVVFDVVEDANATGQTGITYPSIQATRTDPTTGRTTYISAYSAVSNAPTPAVKLAGPPGLYTFTANATVGSSTAQFAAGSVMLGESAVTSTGANVTVDARSSDGAPLPLKLVFSNVSTAGETGVTVTGIGPRLPRDFDQVAMLSGSNYVNLSTTAAATGLVELQLRYDPVALGLTAARERRLVLLHYTCAADGGACAWKLIPETYIPGSPSYFGNTAPAAGNPDTASRTIYGVVPASDFGGVYALAVSRVLLAPPTDRCVGTASDPAQLRTDRGVCTDTVSNVEKAAGGCSGGTGGLVSCTFNGAPSQTLGLGAHTVTIVGTAASTLTSTCTSYVNVVDREAPTVFCPAPVTVECAGNRTPAALTATCTDNCAGSCTASCSAGSYGLGTTPAHCIATDGSNNNASCVTRVIVRDTAAPSLTLTVTPSVLPSTGRRLVPVGIRAVATDRCDEDVRVRCTALSSDPDSDCDADDVARDVVWNNDELFLRGERRRVGAGRTYTITCTATDRSGNQTSRTASVVVR